MATSHAPGKRILIVEDNLDTRDALAFVLRQEGYQVRTACHGQEALDVLHAEGPPNLILLDLLMPTMDGREFCKRIAQEPVLGAVPIVIVSALEGLKEESASLPAAACLSKAADLETLLATIRRHLAS